MDIYDTCIVRIHYIHAQLSWASYSIQLHSCKENSQSLVDIAVRLCEFPKKTLGYVNYAIIFSPQVPSRGLHPLIKLVCPCPQAAWAHSGVDGETSHCIQRPLQCANHVRAGGLRQLACGPLARRQHSRHNECDTLAKHVCRLHLIQTGLCNKTLINSHGNQTASR
jgi:hypothetical protein